MKTKTSLIILLILFIILSLTSCQNPQEAQQGEDGITPHIGDNGNWFIGDTDTGIKAEGEDGVNGLSAYEIYKQQYPDYNGTEEEWLQTLSVIQNPQHLAYYPNNDGTEYGVAGGNSVYLKEIVIPSTYMGKPVTKLISRAFMGYYNLENITIPDTITHIENEAFVSSGIKNIAISSNVTEIGVSAFKNCTNLQTITFGEDIQLDIIEEEAFSNCIALESLIIPKSVTAINSNAFSAIECDIEFEEGSLLTTIQTYAFSNYLGENLILPNSVTTIETYAFNYCSNLKSITLPSNINTISNNLCYYCVSLETINLPDAITSIKNYAFYHCESMQSITIPSNVTSIGNGAFDYCSSLANITVLRNTPPELGLDAFSNNSANRQILVPSGSVGQYKEAANWINYEASIFAIL
ncbi:MAG: leucine-rich repeat domain-containing protein [Clostridia bacterium]|nr:leucine-rich repeat domain-containing protein [Clostridia bacterium]